MARVGFAADLHVGTAPLGLPALAGDPAEALEALADVVEAERLDRLVLAGDLVDRPTLAPEQLAPLWAFLARLAGAGVAVDYLLGQHDGRRRWPSAAEILRDARSPAVRSIGAGVAVDLGNRRRAAALDYTPPQHLADRLAALPAVDVVVLHQQWDELLGAGRADASATSVPVGRWLVSGDFHEHRRVALPDGRTLFSCGATHRRGPDEPDGAGIWIYDTEDDAWSSAPLPQRPVVRLDVDGAMTDEAAAAAASAAVDAANAAAEGGACWPDGRPLLAVRPPSHARRAPLRRRLEAALAGRAVVLVRPPRPRRAGRDAEVGPAGPMAPASSFAEALDADLADDPELRRLLRTLVAAPDRVAALDLARADFLAGAAEAGPGAAPA